MIFLMSDSGFGSIKSRAIKKYLDYSSIKINDPSWKNVIESFGILGTQVSDEESLFKTLDKITFNTLPYYIECHFDSGKYMMMVENLRG